MRFTDRYGQRRVFTVNLSFLITGWLLMLLLGIIHNHTLVSDCVGSSICNPPHSPVPAWGYWFCVLIMLIVHFIVGFFRRK